MPNIEPTRQFVKELKELQEIMRARTGGIGVTLPKHPGIWDNQQRPDGPPQFGQVYFGQLDWFAPDDPHYGMVKGRKGWAGRPVYPFSPITDGRKSNRSPQTTVLLPEGVLPAKYTKEGMKRIISHILLDLTVRVPKWQILSDSHFRYITTLAEEFQCEARAKLDAMMRRPGLPSKRMP